MRPGQRPDRPAQHGPFEIVADQRRGRRIGDHQGPGPIVHTERPDGTGAVQVMYLLSYHFDPGEVNTGAYAHYGDIEFIIFRINRLTPRFSSKAAQGLSGFNSKMSTIMVSSTPS